MRPQPHCSYTRYLTLLEQQHSSSPNWWIDTSRSLNVDTSTQKTGEAGLGTSGLLRGARTTSPVLPTVHTDWSQKAIMKHARMAL